MCPDIQSSGTALNVEPQNQDHSLDTLSAVSSDAYPVNGTKNGTASDYCRHSSLCRRTAQAGSKIMISKT